jgi:hypothetical protein
MLVRPQALKLGKDFDHVNKISQAQLYLKEVGLIAMDCLVDKSSGEISIERAKAFVETEEILNSLLLNLSESLDTEKYRGSLQNIQIKTDKLFILIPIQKVTKKRDEYTFAEQKSPKGQAHTHS